MSPSSASPSPALNHRQSGTHFLQWATKQIQCLQQSANPAVATPIQALALTSQPTVTDHHAESIALQLSEADRAHFDGQAEINIDFSTTLTSPACEPATLDSRLGRWLITKLQALDHPVPNRPHGQPQAVQNITNSLFSAYQVEGGQLHLGGCQLTDYPFLRLTYRASSQTDNRDTSQSAIETSQMTENLENRHTPTDEVFHLFIGPDGSWVPDQMVHELGLLDIDPIEGLPPRIDQATLDTLESVGRRMTAQLGSGRGTATIPLDPIASALIWTKHADGHLQFTIDEASTTLAFSDWAKLLKPPPYVGEYSGASTFHLAATDDGRIDAWEQIGTCEISGQRVLKQELVECSETGQQVLEKFIEYCPVSGKPCLSEQFATCTNCQQTVSKGTLKGGQCAACRQLSRLSIEDPRRLWLLGEHPGLRAWKRWKLAETDQVYIVEMRRFYKRLLMVADKHSLKMKYLATASIVSQDWKVVSDSDVSKYLN